MTRGETRHGVIAQLLIAWSPLSLILVCYAAAAWISAPLDPADPGSTNRLGIGAHVAGPADGDRWLLGTVPSVWLQARWVDGSPEWYDAVAALVYVTHFLAIPLVTAVVWFRLRERFRAWLASVLAFTVVGITGYVVYPAAPPWLASDLGEIGPVDRISHLGWDALGLDVIGRLTTAGQGGSNPVAAMPSLHAGSALLVTLFCWGVTGRTARALLVTYVLLMGATLVYTGEHYVADILAGWVVAGVAVVVSKVVLRTPRPAKQPDVTTP